MGFHLPAFNFPSLFGKITSETTQSVIFLAHQHCFIINHRSKIVLTITVTFDVGHSTTALLNLTLTTSSSPFDPRFSWKGSKFRQEEPIHMIKAAKSVILVAWAWKKGRWVLHIGPQKAFIYVQGRMTFSSGIQIRRVRDFFTSMVSLFPPGLVAWLRRRVWAYLSRILCDNPKVSSQRKMSFCCFVSVQVIESLSSFSKAICE